MKKLLITLGIIFAASTASAQSLTIAAGAEGGGYDAKAQIIKQRLEQRGIQTVVTNNNGSDAITLAACSGNADMWISQIDGIYARAQEGCNLKPTGIYGEEVALLMIPPKAKKDELNEFDKTNTIAVDRIGSGSELFWRTAVKIEKGDQGSNDEWTQTNVIDVSVDGMHTAANFGDIQGVILVRKSNSPDFAKLVDLGWTVGELWDKDINDLEFKGNSLYESKKITVYGSNGKTRKGYGYVVRSYIGVTEKLARDRTLLQKIQEASN